MVYDYNISLRSSAQTLRSYAVDFLTAEGRQRVRKVSQREILQTNHPDFAVQTYGCKGINPGIVIQLIREAIENYVNSVVNTAPVRWENR